MEGRALRWRLRWVSPSSPSSNNPTPHCASSHLHLQLRHLEKGSPSLSLKRTLLPLCPRTHNRLRLLWLQEIHHHTAVSMYRLQSSTISLDDADWTQAGLLTIVKQDLTLVLSSFLFSSVCKFTHFKQTKPYPHSIPHSHLRSAGAKAGKSGSKNSWVEPALFVRVSRCTCSSVITAQATSPPGLIPFAVNRCVS